jgi:protein subunit release factor B
MSNSTKENNKKDSNFMEKYPTERADLERDCELEFIIAGGPGGQHRNKVESGVRLVHRPTGTTVIATERRSQHANREVAFERMAEKLEEQQKESIPRKATRPTMGSLQRKRLAKLHVSQIKKRRSQAVESHE